MRAADCSTEPDSENAVPRPGVVLGRRGTTGRGRTADPARGPGGAA
ncbi:hypothetical protein [Kocuria sp. NPDC057446]